MEKGTNPDECYRGASYTALMHACTGKDGYDIAKLLIEHGSNVNCEYAGYENGSDKGYTPIFYAVHELQNYELVKLLIENDGNINHKGEDGMTPLMIACDASNYKVAILLIKNGANVNAIDKNGNSVLYHACSPRFNYAIFCIVKSLFESGAEPNYNTNNEETLINLVKKNKDYVSKIHTDYKTFDYGEDVIGFDDNYMKIIDLLTRYTENRGTN